MSSIEQLFVVEGAAALSTSTFARLPSPPPSIRSPSPAQQECVCNRKYGSAAASTLDPIGSCDAHQTKTNPISVATAVAALAQVAHCGRRIPNLEELTAAVCGEDDVPEDTFVQLRELLDEEEDASEGESGGESEGRGEDEGMEQGLGGRMEEVAGGSRYKPVAGGSREFVGGGRSGVNNVRLGVLHLLAAIVRNGASRRRMVRYGVLDEVLLLLCLQSVDVQVAALGVLQALGEAAHAEAIFTTSATYPLPRHPSDNGWAAMLVDFGMEQIMELSRHADGRVAVACLRAVAACSSDPMFAAGVPGAFVGRVAALLDEDPRGVGHVFGPQDTCTAAAEVLAALADCPGRRPAVVASLLHASRLAALLGLCAAPSCSQRQGGLRLLAVVPDSVAGWNAALQCGVIGVAMDAMTGSCCPKVRALAARLICKFTAASSATLHHVPRCVAVMRVVGLAPLLHALVMALRFPEPAVVRHASTALTTIAREPSRASLVPVIPAGGSGSIGGVDSLKPAPEPCGQATQREFVRMHGPRALMAAYSSLQEGGQLGRGNRVAVALLDAMLVRPRAAAWVPVWVLSHGTAIRIILLF